jgi:hypothetical protein
MRDRENSDTANIGSFPGSNLPGGVGTPQSPLSE